MSERMPAVARRLRGAAPVLAALLVLVPATGSADSARASPPSPTTAGWAIECVDSRPAFFGIGDQGLRLDGQGRGHAAYVGEQVYYAREEAGGWTVEVVAAAPAAIYEGTYVALPALALDAAGAPQLAFLDPTNRAVRYARRTDAGWRIRTVATAAEGRLINFETALALDREGAPHIVYAEHGTLKYARTAGDGWAIETIDASGFAEMYFSLQLDRAGVPHVSYFYAAAKTAHLKYAIRDAGRWRTEFVDRSGFLGEFNSLALDRDGTPHVSYLDVTHEQLKYARRRGVRRWDVAVVDAAKWFGGFTSIALDRAGRPHVSYTSPDNEARYARWDGARWTTVGVEPDVWYTALALDAADRPSLVYFGRGERDLVAARLVGGQWIKRRVDGVAQGGRHSAAPTTPDS